MDIGDIILAPAILVMDAIDFMLPDNDFVAFGIFTLCLPVIILAMIVSGFFGALVMAASAFICHYGLRGRRAYGPAVAFVTPRNTPMKTNQQNT